MNSDNESVARLKATLAAERAEMGTLLSKLEDLNARLANMTQLRQELAVSKMQETQLRQQARSLRERLGFQTLKAETQSSKIREQIVKLTSALHEIQRRANSESG